MRIVLLFQLFTLLYCDTTVQEYLDAVARFGANTADQSYSSGGMYGAPTKVMVNKEHFLAFKRMKSEVDYINGDDAIPFSAAINQFSILTDSERLLYTGLNSSMQEQEDEDPYYLQSPILSNIKRKKLPKSIDWEELGAQPPVKHQGGCGSCWAYATVSAIECGYYQQTGDLMAFSEQEVLDCTYDHDARKDGCKGGWLTDPIRYVQNADRLASMADNPYRGVDRRCSRQDTPNSLTKAKVVGLRKCKGDDQLKEYLTKGVVSVAVVITNSYYVYALGIYTDPQGCPGRLAHAITVVGYGNDGGRNFWRARNSWGRQWGEQGYVRYNRDLINHCKISDAVVLPLMACREGKNCDKVDPNDKPKRHCDNAWPDSYCDQAASFCRRRLSGRLLEFQRKMQEVCKKSCRMCD